MDVSIESRLSSRIIRLLQSQAISVAINRGHEVWFKTWFKRFPPDQTPLGITLAVMYFTYSVTFTGLSCTQRILTQSLTWAKIWTRLGPDLCERLLPTGYFLVCVAMIHVPKGAHMMPGPTVPVLWHVRGPHVVSALLSLFYDKCSRSLYDFQGL